VCYSGNAGLERRGEERCLLFVSVCLILSLVSHQIARQIFYRVPWSLPGEAGQSLQQDGYDGLVQILAGGKVAQVGLQFLRSQLRLRSVRSVVSSLDGLLSLTL